MFSGAERRAVVMKQYQFKIARSMCLIVVAFAFFILGLIVALQPDMPDDVILPFTLNSPAIEGCLVMFAAAVVIVFAGFDIAVNIAAISESKNEQINRNAYFAKEEERIALLERYKKLYAEGIISEAEFASKKNSILREMGKN